MVKTETIALVGGLAILGFLAYKGITDVEKGISDAIGAVTNVPQGLATGAGSTFNYIFQGAGGAITSAGQAANTTAVGTAALATTAVSAGIMSPGNRSGNVLLDLVNPTGFGIVNAAADVGQQLGKSIIQSAPISPTGTNMSNQMTVAINNLFGAASYSGKPAVSYNQSAVSATRSMLLNPPTSYAQAVQNVRYQLNVQPFLGAGR